MECEENLPEYSGHEDLIEYIDQFGIFSRSDSYYRKCREVAQYYRITLCDELDASLVGWFANYLVVLPRMMEDDVEDLSWATHAMFLQAYVRVNGIPVSEVSEAHRFLVDSTLTTEADVVEVDGRYQVLQRIDDASVVAEIRRLTAIHSVPTVNEIDTELSATGGVIILGREDSSFACDTDEATTLRNLARLKRPGFWSKRAASPSSFMSRKKRMAAEYQIQKCGDREYSLLPNANASVHAPMADGLAPTIPINGRAPHIYPCCILDAKYSTGPFGFYQRRRDYVRKVNATSRSSRFVPPWLRRSGTRGAIAGYDTVRTQEGLQLGAYIGACVLREIPYWRALYICNTMRTASYFSREIIGRRPGARVFAGVVVSLKSGGQTSRQNWIV